MDPVATKGLEQLRVRSTPKTWKNMSDFPPSSTSGYVSYCIRQGIGAMNHDSSNNVRIIAAEALVGVHGDIQEAI
jgi:hypothetical protein